MKTIHDRAMDWILNGERGQSSETIFSVMMTGKPKNDPAHPYDPADLNRCLMLLEKIPEWRERLNLMRGVSAYWDAIVTHWDDLEVTFFDEVGRDRKKTNKAPKTYAKMVQIRDDVVRAKANSITKAGTEPAGKL